MLHKIKQRVGMYVPALYSRNYRLYFIGQGISLVGTWMATIAEQWLVYPTLTNNRSLLGIISAVNLLPMTLFVLFAGVLADRVDRRRAQIIIQSLFAIIAFLLSYLVAIGKVQVWHVMIAAFASGVIFAFDMPTRQSLMIGLVDRVHYASALSLNAGIFNAARAIGPALAGILIAAIGIAPMYFINGISFFAVIISVYLMQLPQHMPIQDEKTLREQFKEGLLYVKNNRIVMILLLLLATLTVFTWPVATLMPVFAHDIFKKGEIGFGMLQSSFGIGAMIGAFGFSSLFHATSRKYSLIMISIAMVVGTIMAFALSTIFWISLVILVISGFATATLIATLSTLIQANVPDTLRGRIMSFYSFVLIGGMPAGALLASLGVATIGARLTIFIGSVLLGITSTSLIAITKGKFKEKLAVLVY